ncbi:MAG TPA: hypothetical protein VHB21_22360 [Minicystis sp.]|nr:hypothetical protein [Minicystis sp.]
MADPRADELWAAVLACWAEEPAHLAFLEHCRATRQLDVAARRYREQAQPGEPYRDDPTHAEIARKKLAAVTALAMLEIDGARVDLEAVARAARIRRLTSRWALVVLVLAGLVVAALRARG